MSINICLLVDESKLLEFPYRARDTKPASSSQRKQKDVLATTLNRFVDRLLSKDYADLRLAICGYKTGHDNLVEITNYLKQGNNDWFLPITELKVESAQGSSGESTSRNWYQPNLGNASPRRAVFEELAKQLSNFQKDASIVVVHAFLGNSSDGNPVQAIESLASSYPNLVIFQFHLTGFSEVSPTIFPETQGNFSALAAGDLFEHTQPIPDWLSNSLREAGFIFGKSPRSLIHNGRFLDLAMLLSGIERAISLNGFRLPLPQESLFSPKDIESTNDILPTDGTIPSIASEFPVGSFHLVLAVDGGVMENGNSRVDLSIQHLRNAGRVLEQLTRLPEKSVGVSVLTFFADSSGNDVLEAELGPTRRRVISPSEVTQVASRFEETVEEIPNGAGGILSIPRRLPVVREPKQGNKSGLNKLLESAADIRKVEFASQGTIRTIVLLISDAPRCDTEILGATAKWAELSGGVPLIIFQWVTNPSLPTCCYPTIVDAPPEFASCLSATSELSVLYPSEIDGDLKLSEPIGFVCNGSFDELVKSLKRHIEQE
jgi:hypothetical protein